VLRIRDIARPAVAADRVLVRVRAASVNALDWHTVHGGFLLKVITALMRQKDFPIRGADLAGVVEDVGADVTQLRPGDEVFGTGKGTFAEFATAPARSLVRKPAQLSFPEAATVGVAALTALQGLRDKGQVKPGQRVLIFGAGGGVGTFAVQIAKALGAHVTAVTGPKNIELIRSLGADELIDYSKEDVLRRGPIYDVILDIAAIRPLGRLRRGLVPGGTLVMVGASKSGWASLFGRIIAQLVRQRLLRQRVVMFMARITQDDLLFLKELIEAGKLRPLIDRQYPLSETAAAVRYLGSGQARAKVVINVS
jgi:NADPH:quinone reductase-like Zn-dependent oxidoreductase